MAQKQDLLITCQNTCWIFVSASNEPRHLLDLALGAQVLRQRGVADKDLYFFVDHPTPDLHFNPLGIVRNILPLDSFEEQLALVSGYEVAIVSLSGHGTEDGVESK